MLNSALPYLGAGLSVIPVNHETKGPVIKAWKGFQQERADASQLEKWFGDGKVKSLAVVCGAVSGGLLVLDFDVDGYYEEWRESVGEFAAGLPVQRTGGGGYQVFFRCPEPGRNQKLAFHPNEEESEGREIAIETRGEGGYVLVPPSLHPSGGQYRWLNVNGSLDIPTVSQAQADALLDAARKLDRAPYSKTELAAQEKREREARPRKHDVNKTGLSVIKQFNQQHPIREMLKRCGYQRASADRFIRPGGHSPSVNILGDRSYHHSTNDPLHGRLVDSFEVYAYYKYGGDKKAAVKAAAHTIEIPMDISDTEETQETVPDGQEDDSHLQTFTPGPQLKRSEVWQMGNENADTGPFEGWSKPTPFEIGDPPVFPVEVLPEPERRMVMHIADIVQCDPALPGVILLGVHSLGIQGFVTVQAGPQREATMLWVTVVAGVSERKSSAFTPMIHPVLVYEKEEIERVRFLQREVESKRRALKARIEKMEKDIENSLEVKEDMQMMGEIQRLHKLLDATPEIFLPALYCDNITEEQLGILMKQNGERMAYISPEPTLFDQIRETKDKRPLLDVFLKAYTGEPSRTDRVGRGRVDMDRPCLTVIVTSQPEVVREFMRGRRNKDRGILSRFLFAPCKRLAGTRLWAGKGEDPGIIREYEGYVKSLLSDKRERALTLSPEALEIYAVHYNLVEKMQLPGGGFDDDGWGGKQSGRALRIAAGLHCAECPEADVISADVMRRAVRLSEYFIEAILYLAGALLEPDESKKLRFLLAVLLAQGKMVIPFHEIHQKVRRHFSNKTEVTRKYMDLLAGRGYIRKLEGNGPESYTLSPYCRGS